MYFRSKKFVSVGLSLLFGTGLALGTVSPVYADKSGGEKVSKHKKADKCIYVSDVFELLQAIDKVPKWGKIILENDIDILSLKVRLNNSIVLDLNGHTITVGSDSAGIVIEDRLMVNQKKIVKNYSSSYVWDEKNHKVKEPFFGGDGYTMKVVDYEASEQYNDDICVTIRNGKIVRKPGKNGKDGIKNTWFKCSGERGETPKAPLILNSGNTYLSNLEVVGGDGGNGGKGAHYAGEHLPINGGCGADGGDAGNGGSAVEVLRKEVRLIVDKECKLSSGNPGVAGKGGEASENYWVYKSKDGSDGKEGTVNPSISYKYKK